ncbi:MAG: alpha/beta hydrolase domain-containing protein [Vicinamibacterales bacterium]
MSKVLSRLLGITLLTMCAVLATAPAHAEVTRVAIASRTDLLNGRTFGTRGAYEVLTGTITFAVDPANPHNRVIVDLDKAPTNAQGRVEFSSDLVVIRPKDPARANGVLLFDVVNRGNKSLLSVFSRATRGTDFKSDAEAGDGYLLREGYTLVFVGWQFDIAMGKGLVGFSAPIATDNGTPIKGWVRMPFISDKPVASFAYGGGYNTATYLPVNVQDRSYRLTVREGIFAPARLIPRDEWDFSRVDGASVVPDPTSIRLKGGFKPGLSYELTFETQNPPVAGLGMAAIRDAASAFKYGAEQVAHGTFAYMYGASQTGRLIRQLIHEGFTIDESGRKVFDAAFIQTGAVGFGSFNERFAQPNELGPFTQTKFPFLYKTTTDPITGREDGLGARIPAGMEPKLFLVDTSSEYWDRGRVAAMRHTTMDGAEDMEDAPNVRAYQLSGTKHGSGSFPPADNGGQFRENTNDYRWAQRGLLAALDAWTRNGVEPPQSTHPSLKDGTLVAHDDFRFPALPGVTQPTFVPGGYRADVPAPVLRVAVPRAEGGRRRQRSRWNPPPCRRRTVGNADRMAVPQRRHRRTVDADRDGRFVHRAAEDASRPRAHEDPRLSIIERYGTKAEYVKRVKDAATSLADRRLILREDIQPITDELAAQWDAVMSASPARTSSR